MKFTKSPWVAKNQEVLADLHCDGKLSILARCFAYPPFPENIHEAEANAKLIAAAPDLLNACIAAEKHHQGGHSEIGAVLRDTIKKATE